MFQTFEDQRVPAAPERGFWEQPDLNENVPRGDILVEAPADPSGWQGSGPPIVTDDRPPGEATSGNSLLTVLLFHDSAQPVLTTLWAFPVTRIIDIIKIPPAKRLEHLPRGWGVLADDLLGSLYAALTLLVIWATFGNMVGDIAFRPYIMEMLPNK